SVTAELERLKMFDKLLNNLDAADLSARMTYDYKILRAAVRKEILAFEDRASYTQQPMTYAGALNVNIYIKREFAPLAQRVRSVVAILNEAPTIFAAARTNLD